MRNGHIMFIYIYIEHRNLEIRKTRNDFWVQVRNFLLPLSFKVLRHKEMDTHSFYSGFFIWAHIVRHLPKASANKRKSTLLVRCPVLNSTNLFQNSPNPPRASGAWGHSHLLAPFPIWAIVRSLSDTFVPPALALEHLRLCLHLSNHALSQKVLSLTKPKGIKQNPSTIILQYCLNQSHKLSINLLDLYTNT